MAGLPRSPTPSSISGDEDEWRRDQSGFAHVQVTPHGFGTAGFGDDIPVAGFVNPNFGARPFKNRPNRGVYTRGRIRGRQRHIVMDRGLYAERRADDPSNMADWQRNIIDRHIEKLLASENIDIPLVEEWQKIEQNILNKDWMITPNLTFICRWQIEENEKNFITKIVAKKELMDKLSQEIEDLYEETIAREEEVNKKEEFRRDMEILIGHYDELAELNWNAKVYPTGSSISGLAATGSDVDLCIFIPHAMHDADTENERVQSLKILQFVRHFILQETQQNTGFPWKFAEINLRDATIPILKLLTECGLECDLSVCCVPFLSGVHNSILIQGYTLQDHRFGPLAIFIKAWSAVTGLKQPCPPMAKFNSYAITLLLIHFLQCGVYPPVLPNLRKKTDGSFYATSEEEFPVVLDVDKFPDVDCGLVENTMSMAELFIRFCMYYSTFDYNRMYISLRESRIDFRARYVPRSTTGRRIKPSQACYVEDPIDQHNPGRTMYDLEGAKRIFRGTSDLFRYALNHPESFPNVRQLLKKEKIPGWPIPRNAPAKRRRRAPQSLFFGVEVDDLPRAAPSYSEEQLLEDDEFRMPTRYEYSEEYTLDDNPL